MECITQQTAASALWAEQWQEFQRQLPEGWEAMAYSSGALVRRRGVRDPQALLQLILAYSVGDWSLRQVGMWATLSAVAAISDVAILNRLRHSERWLSALISAILKQRVGLCDGVSVPICVLDATTISRPGSHGTDWRVHLSLDLAQMQSQTLMLTDGTGGEGFQRFAIAPGEILIADRAYGRAKSVFEVVTQQASLVVRLRWSDLSSYTHEGQPFCVIDWLKATSAHAPDIIHSVELQRSHAGQSFTLRLVACPLPAAKAQEARRRVRRKAQKNQVHVTQASLLAAGFVLLLTNLATAQWSDAQIVQLYRVRWQVELYFKRLKSILHLDHLRAHDPQLAQVYLLAKLLVALVMERLSQRFLAQCPAAATSLARPLSLWRLTALLWSSLQWLLTLPLLRLLHLADPLLLRRYLCNAPRKRLQQDAFARLFVRSLSVVKVLFA